LQSGLNDTSNFDGEFTSEAFQLTPCDKQMLLNLDQNEFESFHFINQSFITAPIVLSGALEKAP
jgi:hypothetical protein